MNWHKRAAIAAALVMSLSIGVIAAACGGDTTEPATGTTSVQPQKVDAINARIQRNEMLTALIDIEELSMHQYQTEAQKGTINERFVPTVRRLVRLLSLTNWSSELQKHADETLEMEVALLAALDTGDVEQVKQPATDGHEAWHEFQEEAWAVLAKDLPLDAGGAEPSEGDDHGGSQGGDMMTPEGEVTP